MRLSSKALATVFVRAFVFFDVIALVMSTSRLVSVNSTQDIGSMVNFDSPSPHLLELVWLVKHLTATRLVTSK